LKNRKISEKGKSQIERPEFIVDQNVGKLTKFLRLLGYDTVFFKGLDDSEMIRIALAGNRIILTRDTLIFKRRIIISGKVKAILIEDSDIEKQIRQVVNSLNLLPQAKPFSICLECNRVLEPRTRDEVKNRVPPYVWKTQKNFMECPECHRIYWQGTHWAQMKKRLAALLKTDRKVADNEPA
jgi:uncharacterized protein with PIN domain